MLRDPMSSLNGQNSTTILLLTVARVAGEIEAQLGDFAVHHVETAEHAEGLLRDSLPTMILADYTPQNLAYFGQLDQRYSVETRPLMAFLGYGDGDAQQSPYPILQSDCLQIQIIPMLQLQKQISALKIQNTRQTQEIDALKFKLKSHERERTEVELLKNAIVRNVSHELKTPLLQVKSAVALLAEDVQNDELINYAMGATGRLETLVRNITMLGGSLEINIGPVIVRDALESVKRTLRRIWEHRNDTERLVVYVEDDLPPVLADKQGLSTVCQLLIDNALKFSKDKVEIRVTRDEDPAKLRFEVRDKGIGIAPDKIERIFDTFYQIDPSSTRKYGGTGVGLAIVKLILDYHQTDIEVTSQIDKGSTFAFTLLIVDMNGPSAPS